jgi:hypothetical protein
MNRFVAAGPSGLPSCVLLSLAFAAPAMAQTDLSGWWARQSQNDNGYANEPVDLIGIPVNADGRAKALSYNIASLSATERQCQMYPPWYITYGPFPLQIIAEQDPVTQKLVAYRIVGWGDRGEQMVWMDGRPHPSPNAPHTHGGFSTGTWEGTSLKVVTTHFKMGDMKRHRAFSSDRATMTWTLTRHDDIMTVTGILDDRCISPSRSSSPRSSSSRATPTNFRSRRANRSRSCRPPREPGARAALPSGQESVINEMTRRRASRSRRCSEGRRRSIRNTGRS